MGGIKLRHYQQTSVEGIRHAYRQNKKAPLLVLPTGAGKCLAYGTKVLMYNGSIKTVENVEVGDIIMGPDSTPRKVLSLARGTEEMYRIAMRNNDAFTCNASHILSLVCNANRSAKFKKDQVYNLSVKEYLALPKSVKHILKAYKSGVEFEHKETGIPPYLLGVWLGDGDSKAFTITTMDKPIVDYIMQYAKNNQMGVNDAPNGETKARRYSLTSSVRGWGNGLTGFLSKHNLTNNKHIPQRYLINSRKNRLELLAGIIDTDGHYNNNCYEVFVMHEQLADDVMFLCRSLGFSVQYSNKRGVQGKRISISGEGLEEIPVLLERKKAHKRMQIKNALRYGFSVVYAGIGNYYGFEIDGDRLFMLGDFTVTHNTVVFTYITQSSASKGKRVLILVHRVELLRQTSAALLKFGVHHGLINPNFTPDRHASTQVASVQTLIKRLHTIAPPDLIIVDESHHALAVTYRTIISHFQNAKVLGVTATPCRGDGSGLGVQAGGIFDDIIIGPQIGDLIKEGYLVKPVIYAPKDRLDLTSVRVKMGDYVSKDLANVVDKPSITGNAVEHYTRICPGTPCVVFCVNVMHAQHVAEEFRAAGYRAFHADGTMEDEERKRILNGLGNGYAQVVTSCDLISEGTDIPAIGCAILLRPTKSTGLYLQQVGRALRPCEGKERAIILDHVGNVLTHGMPDEPREWTLDGDVKRKKKKKVDADAPKVLQCPSCYAMHEPAPSCPLCGHMRPIKQRDLKKVDGELREITETEQYIFRKKKNMEVGMAKTLEDLTAIGNARGYRQGWAIRMFKARQEKKYK